MSPSADFSRSCEGCDALLHEERATGASCYRCGHPGPRQGYMMGGRRLVPYIPAWCPKLPEEGKAKEARA